MPTPSRRVLIASVAATTLIGCDLNPIESASTEGVMTTLPKCDVIIVRVRDIVAEQLGVGIEEVTPDANFIDDLCADSLDTVELVMAVEEEFELEIPDEDAEKFTTVGETAAYLRARLSCER